MIGRQEYARHNKKTTRLKLCENAAPAIVDGKAAQERLENV